MLRPSISVLAVAGLLSCGLLLPLAAAAMELPAASGCATPMPGGPASPASPLSGTTLPLSLPPQEASAADCSATATNPTSEYDPVELLTVQVVVHVIMNSACSQGVVSDALVLSQIEVLNEDFQALPGSNGALGTDTRIQFELAPTDPAGNPTTGITRHCNTTWYNDGGNYYDTLAWDPTRYVNIYTHSAGGSRGYVPFLPAASPGMIGSAADRVVINWLAFGRNGPFPPHDQGRTVTHEVGHYLGLYHPYFNGCGVAGAPGCYTTGDLLCDTPPDAGSHDLCPTGATSCGGVPVPVENYMELTDDLCMTGFTAEQANRMRCTLLGYRAGLLGPPPAGGGAVDWSSTATVSYSNQDGAGTVSVEDGGATLHLAGNRWRRTEATYTLTPASVLEVEFRSTAEGEIHGIGFDENDSLTDATRIFQLFGTQDWTGGFDVADPYTAADLGSFKSFSIPVGSFYTGSGFRLVLVGDDDRATPVGTGDFRNVRLVEAEPADCSVEVDFEGGSAGWTAAPASTCATGGFVLGSPTTVVSSGVTTQPAGDPTSGSGNAFFTAPNSSAGVNDVDGGVCIALSPTYPVSEASTLSVWTFHGQRDAGNDPAGDFFRLELSLNGGATWSPLRLEGDVTSNATWVESTAAIPAGSDVRLRLQAADGPTTGDLVEAGLDDLRVCADP